MNKKYLLLLQPEELYPEQLNSYMFLIMQVIGLSKKLNRCFVLPPLHSHPRNSKLAELGEKDLSKIIIGKYFDGFESIFSSKKLNEYTPCIPFNEFISHEKKEISILYCFKKTFKSTINSFGVVFQIKNAKRLENIYNIPPSDDSNVIAISGLKRGESGIKVNPNWHDDQPLDYWRIRKSLVHNDDLVNEARKFINKNIAERYLAIHWRRSDRNMYGGFNFDFSRSTFIMRKKLLGLVKLIKEKLSDSGTKIVFLATDSGTKWHIDFLRDRLPLVMFPSSGEPEKMQRESIIEQIICIKSNHFISAPFDYESCSSFSRWIIDDRLIQNQESDISYRKVHKSFLDRIFNTN